MCTFMYHLFSSHNALSKLHLAVEEILAHGDKGLAPKPYWAFGSFESGSGLSVAQVFGSPE